MRPNLKLWVGTLSSLFVSACLFDQHVNKGGGASEGVATEVPKGVVSLYYRTWDVNSLGGFDSASALQTWSSGQELQIPKMGALEIKTTDGQWMAYWGPRDWSEVSLLKWDSSHFDKPIVRKISGAVDSVRLDSTPYAAQCPAGLCVLESVPARLLGANIHSKSTVVQHYLRDTSEQQFYAPVTGIPLDTAGATLAWTATTLPSDAPSSALRWIGSPTPDGGGWRMDSMGALIVQHGLPAQAANGGTYAYSIVMDLKVHPSIWAVPVLATCSTAVSSYLNLDVQGRWMNINQNIKSPWSLAMNQWKRVVLVVDVLNQGRMDMWVNGVRSWSMATTLPASLAEWSEQNTCIAASAAAFPNSSGVGYFKLFSTSGNARSNVSLKALAIFPTALSDSLVAKLGTP